MAKMIGINVPDRVYEEWAKEAWDAHLTVPMWCRRIVEARKRPDSVAGSTTDCVIPTDEESRRTIPALMPESAEEKLASVPGVKKAKEAALPKAHSLKCTCVKCQQARGWRG